MTDYTNMAEFMSQPETTPVPSGLIERLNGHLSNLREVVRGFTPWIDQSDARTIIEDFASAQSLLSSQAKEIERLTVRSVALDSDGIAARKAAATNFARAEAAEQREQRLTQLLEHMTELFVDTTTVENPEQEQAVISARQALKGDQP